MQMPGVNPLTVPATESAAGAAVPLAEGIAPEDPAQWPLATSTGRRAGAPSAAGTMTSNVWTYLVAITPLIAAAAAIYVIAANSYVISSWMLPVALAAPYLLGILFAVADRSRLVTEGVENAVPWWWAALTAPVYLIQRAGEARKQTGNGGPALIVWFVCFLLAIAAIVGWGFIAHHPLLAGLPS
jgi:hypothetical protein